MRTTVITKFGKYSTQLNQGKLDSKGMLKCKGASTQMLVVSERVGA